MACLFRDRRRIDARGCADYAATGGHRSQGPYQPAGSRLAARSAGHQPIDDSRAALPVPTERERSGHPGRLRSAYRTAGQHGRPDIGRRASVGRSARSAGAGDRTGRQVVHRFGSTRVDRGSQRHDGGCLAGRLEVSAENVVAGHRRRDVRLSRRVGARLPGIAPGSSAGPDPAHLHDQLDLRRGHGRCRDGAGTGYSLRGGRRHHPDQEPVGDGLQDRPDHGGNRRVSRRAAQTGGRRRGRFHVAPGGA